MKWQLVPEKPTPEMVAAGVKAFQQNYNSEDVCEDWRCCYKAMLAASPQPEHDRMTKEEAQAMQDWKGMDGAIAFHLIERHADGWHQVGEMMDAWLEANRVPNVDHCHKTKAVRGILCNRCNTVLGLCKDDDKLLSALAGYLRR